MCRSDILFGVPPSLLEKAGFGIDFDLKTLRAELQTATSEFKKFNQNAINSSTGVRTIEEGSRKAAAGLGGLTAGFGKLTAALGIANVASNLAYHGIDLLKQAFVAPLNNARSFETSMARISTVVAGSTAESMKLLGHEVLEMTKKFPKSKEEMGAGLYQILQSGVENSADAMKVLEVSTKAAVGGVTEIDIAAKVLTDTMNAYGMSAADATKIADIMFIGARMGTAEFKDLAGSMGNVNATAALLGISVNEVVAAIETMSLAGISADEGATALNRLMLSVVDPSEEVKKVIGEINKKFKDFEFSAEGLKKVGIQGFMKQLSAVVGDNQQMMVALTGDVRAFKAAAVIAGTGADNFTRILEATRTETGALQQAFIKNADTVDNLVVVAWNALIATVTEAAQDHLPELKEEIGNVIETLEENEESIYQTAAAFTGALVSAFQTVIANAPGIIAALSSVASAAASAASAISSYIGWASKVGEQAVKNGLYVKGYTFGGQADIDLANEMAAAHKDGKLYRDVQDEQRMAFNTEFDANQSVIERNARRQEDMQRLATNGPMSAGDAAIYEQLRSGMTMEDVLAAQLRDKGGKKPGGAGAGGGGGKKKGGGGGKSKAEKEAEKEAKELSREQVADAREIMREIERIQKKIVDGLDDEAKAHRTNLNARKDELETWEKLGIMSEAERKELEKINKTLSRNPKGAGDLLGKIEGQLEHKKELIDDATEKWEEQVEKVKEVEETIKDLNESIADERKELAETLLEIDKDLARQRADIGRDALRTREEKAADLVKELKALDDKLARGEGNSEQELRRRAEIEATLRNGGADLPAKGEELAGLNEFQQIGRDTQQKQAEAEAEAERKRQDARAAAAARIAELEADLAAENVKLEALKKTEQEAKVAVIDALSERETFARESFARVDEFTKKHVDSQVEQASRLRAAFDALSAVNPEVGKLQDDPVADVLGAPRFADGGTVAGPGGTDKVLAWLTAGEEVINRRAAEMYRPLLKRVNALSLPRFATGGTVSTTYDQRRTAEVHQHFHHALLSDPALHRWHVRAALR